MQFYKLQVDNVVGNDNVEFLKKKIFNLKYQMLIIFMMLYWNDIKWLIVGLQLHNEKLETINGIKTIHFVSEKMYF